MKVGDLVIDHTDNEVGLVVATGPGIYVEGTRYPDGLMPSWKVDWPSTQGRLVDIGEDCLLDGTIEVFSEAR
tara:strand:+ start:1234 stop:1449 length:216 start_codon:yes stop_codon:yes gene_type:complete